MRQGAAVERFHGFAIHHSSIKNLPIRPYTSQRLDLRIPLERAHTFRRPRLSRLASWSVAKAGQRWSGGWIRSLSLQGCDCELCKLVLTFTVLSVKFMRRRCRFDSEKGYENSSYCFRCHGFNKDPISKTTERFNEGLGRIICK